MSINRGCTSELKIGVKRRNPNAGFGSSGDFVPVYGAGPIGIVVSETAKRIGATVIVCKIILKF